MFTEGFEFEEDEGEEYSWDLGDSVEWATGSEVRENFFSYVETCAYVLLFSFFLFPIV